MAMSGSGQMPAAAGSQPTYEGLKAGLVDLAPDEKVRVPSLPMRD